MKKFLSYLVILTLAASCTSTEMEEMESLPIDVDLLFSLRQTLPASNGHFFLEMTNSEGLDCSNSFFIEELSISSTTTPGTYDLVIDGVDTDGDCIPSADVTLTKEYVIPQGINDYEFMITNKGVMSEGKLRVMEDRLTVAFLSTSGFEFEKLELKRVPAGIAWGWINLSKAEVDLAKEFSTLQQDAVGQLEDLLLDGDYGYFVVNDWTQLIEINGSSDFEQSFLLNMNNDADWTALDGLLMEMEQRYPTLSYNIVNSNGETLTR